MDENKKPVPSGQTQILSADIYVYALGQDGNSVDRHLGEVAVGGFLKDFISDLEPQYDINQAFSDKPYETVLGFQIKAAGQPYPADTGLEVIGAAASTIASSRFAAGPAATMAVRWPSGLRLKARTPDRRLPIMRRVRIAREIANPNDERTLQGRGWQSLRSMRWSGSPDDIRRCGANIPKRNQRQGCALCARMPPEIANRC